jgi:hypothetical protein
MATRYVPKPTKEKHSSKPLYKTTLKEFSTSNNNQPIKRNHLPIRVSAIESDFLMQKLNGDDEIMIEGTLTHCMYCC